MSIRMDMSFDAYIQFTISKLLQWSAEYWFFVGSVPIVYEPFVEMDVGVETQPTALSAGVQFDVSQDVTVGYYYDRVWKDCPEQQSYTECSYWSCTVACWVDDCVGESSDQNCGWWKTKYDCYSCSEGTYEEDSGYILEFGELTKSVSASESVSSDSNGDFCPDIAQHFGFDINPQIKVGAVFYDLVGVYARQEYEFPFRLTMPQSDGPTCGNGASYDMCSTSGPKQASWSIEGVTRFYVGLDEQTSDVIDAIWNQITSEIGTASTLLEEITEYQIGDDLSLGTLGEGCFDLPDFTDDLYSKLCCSNVNANHDFMEWIPEHDDNTNAYEPMDRPVLEIEITPKVALMALLVAVVFVIVMIYFVCFQCGTLRKQRGYRKVVYLGDVDSEN